jgi:ribosomal protein S18 acetylase RimI-like enzyme
MDEIEESNATFQELWAMYANGAGGDVVKQPGIVATWAGVQWPIMNMVFLSTKTNTLEDLEKRLDQVDAFTRTKQHPGMLIGCDPWLPANRASVFEKHGWIQISEAHGMVAESPDLSGSTEGLECRRVEGQELRRAVADLNAAGYEVSVELGREALDHEELWSTQPYGYVGFVGGEPAVTATTYVRDGYLYVALVATQHKFRSRGFARALTSYSIAEAGKASGLRRTILHATPMARSIYVSLGFRPVTTFPMFLPAALLGGA